MLKCQLNDRFFSGSKVNLSAPGHQSPGLDLDCTALIYLHYTILYCNELNYTVLQWTKLYSTIFCRQKNFVLSNLEEFTWTLYILWVSHIFLCLIVCLNVAKVKPVLIYQMNNIFQNHLEGPNHWTYLKNAMLALFHKSE